VDRWDPGLSSVTQPPRPGWVSAVLSAVSPCSLTCLLHQHRLALGLFKEVQWQCHTPAGLLTSLIGKLGRNYIWSFYTHLVHKNSTFRLTPTSRFFKLLLEMLENKELLKELHELFGYGFIQHAKGKSDV
jgi:hypothetical protein